MTTWIRNQTDPNQRTCTVDVSSLVDGSFAPTNTSLVGKLFYRVGLITTPAAGTLTNTGQPGRWLYQAPQSESNVDTNEVEYAIVDTTWYAQTLVSIQQTASASGSSLAPGGPTYLASDLVARARAYVGDDNNETPGWTADSTWLSWLSVEYGMLYRRWVRNAVVRPKPTETTFVSAVTLEGVLCIVAVADTSSPGLIGTGQVRILEPAQDSHGADPFWSLPNTAWPNLASRWAVHGISDELTIELDPPDQVTTYTVRWIPTPGIVTADSDLIALPSGGDERLVIGTAMRATVKDGARLSLLEQLRTEMDAEETFNAVARAGGLAARRKHRHHRNRYSDNPRDWYFF